MQKAWRNLLSKYTTDETLIQSLFDELTKHYTEKTRFYHNLAHIEALLNRVEGFLESLSEPDVLLFSIWYHDVIYNVLRKDNEHESAVFARKKLNLIGLPESMIDKICKNIERTANHFVREPDESEELQILLDADLQTLGSQPEVYDANTKAIRKEYRLIPDALFNKGRAAVLEKFLAMPEIYRTEFFKSKFENQARINLQDELRSLRTW